MKLKNIPILFVLVAGLVILSPACKKSNEGHSLDYSKLTPTTIIGKWNIDSVKTLTQVSASEYFGVIAIIPFYTIEFKYNGYALYHYTDTKTTPYSLIENNTKLLIHLQPDSSATDTAVIETYTGYRMVYSGVVTGEISGNGTSIKTIKYFLRRLH